VIVWAPAARFWPFATTANDLSFRYWKPMAVFEVMVGVRVNDAVPPASAV